MFSLSFRPLNSILKEEKKVSTKTLFFRKKPKKNNKNRWKRLPQSCFQLATVIYLFNTTWSVAPLTILFSLWFLLSFRSFTRMPLNCKDARARQHVVSIGKCEILKYRALHTLGELWENGKKRVNQVISFMHKIISLNNEINKEEIFNHRVIVSTA